DAGATLATEFLMCFSPIAFDMCRFLAGFAVYPMPVSLGPCRLFRRDCCCGTAAILNCMKNLAAWHPLLLDYDRVCGSIGRSIVAGGHSVPALFMRVPGHSPRPWWPQTPLARFPILP